MKQASVSSTVQGSAGAVYRRAQRRGPPTTVFQIFQLCYRSWRKSAQSHSQQRRPRLGVIERQDLLLCFSNILTIRWSCRHESDEDGTYSAGAVSAEGYRKRPRIQ